MTELKEVFTPVFTVTGGTKGDIVNVFHVWLETEVAT